MRARIASYLSLILIVAALLVAATTLGPFAHATAGTPPRATAPASVPVVIQGRVTAVGNATLTVRTPEQRPPCAVGKICPMYIVAGSVFTVDLSTATYEIATGRPTRDKLTVGANVVIVATPKSPAPADAHVLRALVVERMVVPTSSLPKG